MQVILTENLIGTGKKYDVITVKDGFALNYLLPYKKAILASPHALKDIEKRKARQVMKKEEIVANAAGIKDTIDGKVYVMKEKISEKGHLYGSIGEKEIAALLKKKEKN